ncbi:hypothetical protein BPO_0936 [Bergeyella porcorum]|uniref:CopG family transcriptional regulator n=1 Tax=Bergeyella porcorum TaxID=1735111 RepID=A0AAU0F1D4_9FLAO
MFKFVKNYTILNLFILLIFRILVYGKKESLAELKSYIPKVRGYKPSKRLESLILIKSDQYKKLENYATRKGVDISYARKWLMSNLAD